MALQFTTRTPYEEAQIERSRAKFGYCKVPLADVQRYHAHLGPVLPVCCLGVRNGQELDRFRAVWVPWGQVLGVEINPDCQRPDVRVSSFDDLPAQWMGQFGLVFSNSLDHSQDPRVTVRIWQGLLRVGGTLILAVNGHAEPTEADCAQFRVLDLCLWLDACELVRQDEGHYPEAWFRRVR